MTRIPTSPTAPDLAAAKDALNEASKITKADVTAAEWDALQTAIGKTDAAVKAYETSDKLAADKAKAIAELQRRVDNGAAWNDEMLEAAKNAINAVIRIPKKPMIPSLRSVLPPRRK